MNKKYFVLHLLPSRSNFAQTMSVEEQGIMAEHVTYWTNLMQQGMVVVFGPVFDPKGTYGLGIIAVDDENLVPGLIENDPAGKINRYEYYPMMAIVPEA